MQRRHDLDWVRILAFALLVPYHVGMYYVSWDFHVKSAELVPALEPLMVLSAPWRLALLFLVSGVATAHLLAKRPQGFLPQRSWRLLLPLLFGMYVVVPPQAYFELVEKVPGGYSASYLGFMADYLKGGDLHCMAPGDCVDAPTWNHLWFIAYLWLYTAVLWGARLLPLAWRDNIAGVVRKACSGQGILWWPMLVLVATRVLVYPHAPSSHDLVEDAYNHLQYGLVFAIGYLLASADGVWETLRRYRHRMLLLAIASYVLMLALFFAFDGVDPIPSRWMSLIWTFWGMMEWAAMSAILGYARSWNPKDSPLLRYLTAAVFPFYILHQTVIVVLAHSLKPLHIAPVQEGPLLIGVTFALCLLGYEVIRRVPLLRPLFGLKREATPRPVPGAPPATG
ncbi:acyltransferase family protein [Thermomonas carbonis]|uniref:Acyltransferase family protein n=1 Tax=Thermomonas carbonis TaxID=1463158 RepID=A0A7G9SNZ2_9GAMM|nr:acyltransferase family protein [Thermomonas carbonis]QNN69567.1 acyltransferase family protein [Thermomonas carbonis]GHB93941.1 acyltransferase [Thermomonas carbonis]